MRIEAGTRIGPYTIESQIAVGGMGEVWRAKDSRVDRVVALKVLPEDLFEDAARRSRFEREAKLLASLNHPAIATLYSFEEFSGRHLLAMELVEGRGLDERIAEGPLPLDEVLSIAAQIAEALEAAHEKGVIHRDLKPANIMLSAGGRIKLLDFGLARRSEDERFQNVEETWSHATQEGAMMGTFPYMSPEQVSGRPMDYRTDIFSFGIILYEMAVGQRPFRGNSLAELVTSILRDAPPSITEFRRDLPRNVANIINRCLRKEPRSRPDTARDVASAIAALRPGERGPVPATDGVSIAVLPFADMSPGKDQEYLCEGMAEEIMSALGGIGGIRVASRTSTFRASRQGDDLATLAQILNVNQILEGSVRTAARRIRVTAQLTDPNTGFQLWSARYDRDAGDIFAIQDEIAAGVVEAVAQRLSERQSIHLRSQVHNLEAYHLYLQGRHLRYTKNNPIGALQAFEKAVELDPLYGPAWVNLAETNLICASYGLKPSAEAIPAAKDALATARNRQGETGMARYVEGGIATIERRWKDTERAMVRAVLIEPDDVTARCWLGIYYASQARIEEALPHFDHAREIDPLAPYPYCLTALGLLEAQRAEEAEPYVEQALAFDDTNSLALWISGAILVARKQFDRAISRLERAYNPAHGNTFIHAALGWAYAAAGRTEDARRVLAEIQARAAAGHAISEVWLVAALGDHDLAFEILDRIYDEQTLFLSWTGLPGLDPLRSDPRFVAFLERMEQPLSKALRE